MPTQMGQLGPLVSSLRDAARAGAKRQRGSLCGHSPDPLHRHTGMQAARGTWLGRGRLQGSPLNQPPGQMNSSTAGGTGSPPSLCHSSCCRGGDASGRGYLANQGCEGPQGGGWGPASSDHHLLFNPLSPCKPRNIPTELLCAVPLHRQGA